MSKIDANNPDVVRRYILLRKRGEKVARALELLAAAAKGKCPCPQEHGFQGAENHDDGYGRWWHYRYHHCNICNQRKRIGGPFDGIGR